MRPPLPDAEGERFGRVAAALGYTLEAGYILRGGADERFSSRHAIRQAFELIGVAAVYGVPAGSSGPGSRFVPVVYIVEANDGRHADRIHTAVWSQGLIPVLLVCLPGGLEIRNGFVAPSRSTNTLVRWDRLEGSGGRRGPTALRAVRADGLRNSLAWQNFVLPRAQRVDGFMLSQISGLAQQLATNHPGLRDRPDLVNNAIGRFLYLYLLVDKGFLTQKWVDGLRVGGNPACPEIQLGSPQVPESEGFWPAQQTWLLFDGIDDVMNGAIFPIDAEDRARLPQEALHTIRRVMRNADRLKTGGRELGMFEVSFESLRTETISGIYELFLSLRTDDSQTEDGAFYTPPFLADFVLDTVEDSLPIKPGSRVLDPSTGSGIFLVGAYRRILEKAAPESGWSVRDLSRMRQLLEESIFGIERDAQAAGIARFSLYLTMLDYVVGSDIEELSATVGEAKVFPALADNVVTSDAFAHGLGFGNDFTHVVGNPPWGALEKERERAAGLAASSTRSRRETAAHEFLLGLDETRPVAERRQSELFVWRAERDFLGDGGILGLVIATRSFVSRSAESFPAALSRRLDLVGLADFSHFRYRLFKEARAPALAVFARKSRSKASGSPHIWIYAPRLDSQAFGGKGDLWSIVASDRDVEFFTRHDLMDDSSGCFRAIMLKSIDRRFAVHIQNRASADRMRLENLLQRSDIRRTKGASPSEANLPKARRIDPKTYIRELGLDGDAPTYAALTPAELAGVPASYRQRFSGGVVLMPRGSKRFDYVEQPMFYSSTFNVLHLDDAIDDERRTALRALVSYLNSPVAGYLMGLIGRTFRLDARRLEWGDLRALPVPAADIAELSRLTHSIGKPADWTSILSERFGLQKTFFLEVVEEYTSFRSGYQDGKLPDKFTDGPDADEEKQYRAAIVGEFAKLFGETAEIHASDHVQQNGKEAEWRVAIATDFDRAATNIRYGFAPRSIGQCFFPASGSVTFEPDASQIVIRKPWMKASWTLEQAYIDITLAKSLILDA